MLTRRRLVTVGVTAVLAAGAGAAPARAALPTVDMEAVVKSDSPMVGRSLADIRLRQRYQVNVLALSRRSMVTKSFVS